jgi:hypothetical protein
MITKKIQKDAIRIINNPCEKQNNGLKADDGH